MSQMHNTNAASAPIPAATKLRRALAGDDIIVAPGVYDGFSARIALETGFDTIYMVLSPRHHTLTPCSKLSDASPNRLVPAPAPPSWASPTLA